jgi:hypothetical protein
MIVKPNDLYNSSPFSTVVGIDLVVLQLESCLLVFQVLQGDEPPFLDKPAD